MSRLLTYLVYGLIIFIPFGVLFRQKLFTNVYIMPQDVIVFAILIISILLNLRNKINLFSNKFLLFQALFILTGTISLVINVLIYKDVNLPASFLYTLRYMAYLNIFTLGFYNLKINHIKTLIFTVGVILVIAGFTQFFFYNNLKYLFYLGWDDHLYRLFSTFLDPNFAGIFYVIIFFYLLYYAINKNVISSYKELILSFFTLISVYLTYSRTALISLLVSLITLGIIRRKFRILILALFFMVGSVILLSDTGVEGLNPLRTASTMRRLESYSESISIIQKSSLLGVGFNAYRYAQLRYGTREQVGASKSNADAGTDNSYLFVLATTGIIGFTFFVLSYIFLVHNLIREKLKINLYLVSCIIAFLAGGFFINVLFYTPVLSFLFILIAFRKRLE